MLRTKCFLLATIFTIPIENSKSMTQRHLNKAISVAFSHNCKLPTRLLKDSGEQRLIQIHFSKPLQVPSQFVFRHALCYNLLSAQLRSAAYRTPASNDNQEANVA